jgi:hypothetical protein
MIGVVLAKMQTDITGLMEARDREKAQEERQRRTEKTEPRGKSTLH